MFREWCEISRLSVLLLQSTKKYLLGIDCASQYIKHWKGSEEEGGFFWYICQISSECYHCARQEDGIEMRFKSSVCLREDRSIKITKIQSKTAWFFLIIHSLLVWNLRLNLDCSFSLILHSQGILRHINLASQISSNSFPILPQVRLSSSLKLSIHWTLKASGLTTLSFSFHIANLVIFVTCTSDILFL